ncbi:hypothetical protein C1893_23190 [Pseudomonas sp. MPR-ANC1]|nr:DUF6746 family protein [Pseudomonas sp. MPR-ANC1]POA45564.1 hypothetical protein C1893_23190 [Pseudomonas sp. MPR-ANC1]
MNVYGLFGGALVVVVALWAADHYRQSENAAQQKVDTLAKSVTTLTEHNELLAQALNDRTLVQEQLAQVSQATRQMESTLATQSAQINRNFDELKRNDKEIADYLRQPVPAALGLRYARPETTDPVAYRAAATGLRESGAVPSAGATAAQTQ